MVRSVKSHHEEEEEEDEELVPGTTDGSSQKVKLDGKSTDQKVIALRSKHSETEQRRRSKINERFQILRDLIPQNDQKRDKASFLLEVIQYIQFLQEKLQMYEGSYQGWTQEPSKLMPWKNNCGPGESFIDQSQLMRNGSGQEDNIVVTPAITNAQNSVECDLDEVAAYKGLDHTAVPANHVIPLNIPLQSSVHGEISPQPRQASLSDSENLASLFQSHYWQSRPCTTEGAVPSNTLNEQEELKVESGEASISNAYSQGLLNTLTQALQSSGVDLTQASISVQLDVGKRVNTGLDATMFSAKDHRNQSPGSQPRLFYGVGSCGDDSDQAHKRLRTEHI